MECVFFYQLPACSLVYSCFSFRVLGVDVHPSTREKTNRLEVTFVGCQKERCPPVSSLRRGMTKTINVKNMNINNNNEGFGNINYYGFGLIIHAEFTHQKLCCKCLFSL